MAAIDLHAHLIVLDAIDAMAQLHPEVSPKLVQKDGRRYLHQHKRAPQGPIPEGLFDVDRRLADMDAQRVEVQVLSLPPPQFHYQVDVRAGADFARIHNDTFIGLCDRHPDRFAVFAHLPLQDPAAAVAEIERMLPERHVRGVGMGSTVDGANLDDPALEPVWSALEQADLPVWVHPDFRSMSGADRMKAYYLVNLVGNPLETALAIASLIFGGVLERHPALRFGFCHGGGFAPYQVGRWDYGYRRRAEASVNIHEPPSTYFERMFFDTLTHDPVSLLMLARKVGWDQIVLGSDYPMSMGSEDPRAVVDGLRLPAAVERKVLWDNAERFLR